MDSDSKHSDVLGIGAVCGTQVRRGALAFLLQTGNYT
jgi:hypothetical protein